MPPLIIAAVAGIAAIATSAAIGGTIGLIVGGVVGLLISTAGSMLLSSLTPKPTVPDSSQDRKQAIRSAIEPYRIVYGRSLVSGPVLYIGTSGTQNEYFHIIVALAGHVVEEIEEVWINERHIVLEPRGSDGTDALNQGPLGDSSIRIHAYDGTQTDADAALITDTGDWTSAHKLLGIAYVYVRLEYVQDKYPSGFQSISAVVKGKKVFDPRDDSTAWSDNAALCIRDYLVSSYGMGAAADEIDEPYFEAAANICDETVYLDSEETIPQIRYALNGTFKVDMQPIDVMERMLSACAGALVYIQGAYRLHVGAYDAPAITLTESDFAGPIKVVTRTPRRELFNQVVGTYINPAQDWSAVAFPMVSVTDFVTADGQPIQRNVEFPFTTDRAMVQRLARIDLLRARRPLTIEAPMKYSTLRVAAWDTVAVTLADFGWSEKVFRVKSWKYDPVSLIITLRMQEEYSTSYSWTYLDAGPDLSMPEPTLVNPLSIPVPSSLSVTPTTALNADGTVVPALAVSWSLPAHPFVTSTEIQWKLSTDSVWSSRQIASPTATMVIDGVISGLSYNVRARAVAGLVRSDWTSTETLSATADTTPPSVPGSVAAVGISTGISITWTKPTQGDFVAVEVWENTTSDPGSRYYVGQSSGSGFLRSGLGGGQTRYYWVRSYDRSGNFSDVSSVVSATSAVVDTVDINAGAVTVLYSEKETDTIAFDDGTLYSVMSVAVVVPDGSSRVSFTYMLDMLQIDYVGDSGTGSDSGEGDGGGA